MDPLDLKKNIFQGVYEKIILGFEKKYFFKGVKNMDPCLN